MSNQLQFINKSGYSLYLMSRIPHEISLGLILAALWLLLSGHFDPLLLSLGLLSVALVVWIAWRMDVIDHESHPRHLPKLHLTGYWFWLLKAIIQSSIDVCRCIVLPSMPISPTRIKVKTSQESDLGKVIYANSITLTPGTVSISIDEDMIDVHALITDAALDLERGEMDHRVTEVEGSD